MKKALIVGINYYSAGSPLYGCVNDAYSVKSVLERNADGTVNFGAKLLVANGSSDEISKANLKAAIRELFSGESSVALFYFAGHGHIESVGGYILASDARSGDDGLPLAELLSIANDSAARSKVIVLDSCHSGVAGSTSIAQTTSILSDGLTIMTASTAEQYATEADGSGVFTNLFVDALSGAAANLLGDITPGSVYAHIDQSLGEWDQRPVFKTNVKNFVSLRKSQPPILLAELQRLPELFPAPGSVYPLDPSYEPTSNCSNSDNSVIFGVLQRLNRVNLLIPVDAPHMWHAAMESKGCKLTVLGEHYRNLAIKNRI